MTHGELETNTTCQPTESVHGIELAEDFSLDVHDVLLWSSIQQFLSLKVTYNQSLASSSRPRKSEINKSSQISNLYNFSGTNIGRA